MEETFVFLDVDTEVDSNWLIELIKLLESDKSIGATTSKVLYMDDRGRIDHAGVFIIPYVGWAIARGGDKEDDGTYDFVENVCALSTALAVKRKVIARVGPFDPELAVYSEDLDFSWRIWLGGYKVMLASRSVVYHWKKPITMRERISGSKARVQFHLSKNSLRSMTKNYNAENLIKYLPWAITVILAHAFVLSISKKDPLILLESVEGILWNIRHIRSTLKERYKVQRLSRRVTDSYIIQKIMAKEPLSIHIYRRYFSRLTEK